MSSTSQLKVGQKGHIDSAKAFWQKHNQAVSRGVKTLQNTNRNGCRFFSVCYSAPDRGWKKAVGSCRAHINVVGKTEDNCEILSMDLQHTCHESEAKRKRNYKLKDIALLSEAVQMYQPTANREGNARQLKDITKVSTGFTLKTGQAYRYVHERSSDTIHAQIGQYMLLPDLFQELKLQDPDGTHLLESQECSWNNDLKQFRRCYVALSFMKHFWKRSLIRMIVIDGTHTKLNAFKHIILIAVTYDGNNEIVILAFAVVDVENKDNWVWFHERLREDFPSFEVIMCDADKGITSYDFQLSQDEAEALTSRCARHLAENCREACKFTMNSTHKNLILSLAKCRTEETYLECLDKIRGHHREWADWLDERKHEFAAYLFLRQDIPRWGKATSNAVENINSSLLDIRNLPILYLLLGTIEKIQGKYLAGFRKAQDMIIRKRFVTDHAYNHHQRLAKEAVRRKVFITLDRDDVFHGKVSSGDPNSPLPKFLEVKVIPSEWESYCPCMLYQEEGIRCVHIIALLKEKGHSMENRWWYSQRYHIEQYRDSYSAEVPPIALPKLDVDLFYAPPDHKRAAGRPGKVRKDRSWMNKTTNQKQCSSCGMLGHFYSTCDAPSTQFRFNNHYNKAVAWAKEFSSIDFEKLE